ncbi:BA14K family protein [Xanthobacter sp. TB0139]|uniref:BA14K family protein n=1 Tax=Xanthobacter sp. TB0139 TaxID=3459178 RepID=UPI00403A497F
MFPIRRNTYMATLLAIMAAGGSLWLSSSPAGAQPMRPMALDKPQPAPSHLMQIAERPPRADFRRAPPARGAGRANRQPRQPQGWRQRQGRPPQAISPRFRPVQMRPPRAGRPPQARRPGNWPGNRPGWNRPGWNRPGWNRPGWRPPPPAIGRPGRPGGRPSGWGRPGWRPPPGAWGPGRWYPGRGWWRPGWGWGYYNNNGAWIALGTAAALAIGAAAASQSAPVADADAIAYCARKFRSYNPRTGTYTGYDGRQHRCP